MKLATLFFALLSTVYPISAYHILCLHNVPSVSHHNLARGIVNPLLKAGHQIMTGKLIICSVAILALGTYWSNQYGPKAGKFGDPWFKSSIGDMKLLVTWVTPFPSKVTSHPNLTIIDVSSVMNVMKDVDSSKLNNMAAIKEITTNVSLETLRTEAVLNSIIDNQYDAVLSEWFHSDMEAGYAAVQQVPWILLSSTVMHPHLEYLVDTVRSITTYPLMSFDFPVPMTFIQRIKNTLAYLQMAYGTWKDSTPKSLYESSFTPIAEARGVSLPPFSAARHDISVLLVNSHPSFSPALSLPPNVVEIAGFHIDEEIPALPTDLQEILDNATQGAIYFSMGSILKSSSFSEDTRNELITMLAEQPYTVLWKYEEEIKDLPKNIHIRNWMPQTSILAHPNVKVFITHAGLLSSLEALHFGVPLLAVPVMGDQHLNAENAVKAGRAVKVQFEPTMVPNMEKALTELLEEETYYQTAKYLAKIFRNRPTTPSKQIVHYVELAIESQGAHHIRSKTLLYRWYQIWMLDQFSIVLLALFAFNLMIYLIIRLLIILFKLACRKMKERKNIV